MDPQRNKKTAYLVTVRPIPGVTIRRVLFEHPDQILVVAGPTRRYYCSERRTRVRVARRGSVGMPHPRTPHLPTFRIHSTELGRTPFRDLNTGGFLFATTYVVADLMCFCFCCFLLFFLHVLVPVCCCLLLFVESHRAIPAPRSHGAKSRDSLVSSAFRGRSRSPSSSPPEGCPCRL